MRKESICWITSSFLLDVDLPIVPVLQEKFNIDWWVFTTPANFQDDKEAIERSGYKNARLIIERTVFIHPKRFLSYWKLLKQIKKEQYDIYYFDFLGMPYFMPLVHNMLHREKCVVAIHNVKTPKGARYYWMAKPYMNYVIKNFMNIQVFSQNQLEFLQSIKKNANILYAPLCLKDYGEPKINKVDKPITFLFFGNIVEYKRLDILLQATHILKERGLTDFKVKICGYCRPEKWISAYSGLCAGLDNVELDIRRIPNAVIPDLFESCHYFVMPYQDIAQSGAMTVALRYNIPIIASELDSFKEFMNGKDDGYFFRPGDEQDLANVMEQAICEYEQRYSSLRQRQAVFIKEKLSNNAIVIKYETYFREICHN